MTLQAGRAFAALAVVLYHCAIAVEGFVGTIPYSLKSVLNRGYLGVDFFFVLSGFIIYYSNRNKERNAGNFFQFVKSRILRIFVPYLPIAVLLAFAYLLLPGLSASNRSWSWLSTLFLLPSSDRSALNVAWTLQHELVFYVFFAIAVFFVRNLWTSVLLWSLCIITGWALGLFNTYPEKYFLGAINFEFVVGLLFAHFICETQYQSEKLIRFINSSCTLLAALSFGAFILLGANGNYRILFALSIAFAFYPIINSEIEGKITISSWLLLLGNASYSIYLIHDPFISVAIRVLLKTPVGHSGLACIVICFVSAVIVGCIYYFCVERTGLKITKNLLMKKSNF